MNYVTQAGLAYVSHVMLETSTDLYRCHTKRRLGLVFFWFDNNQAPQTCFCVTWFTCERCHEKMCLKIFVVLRARQSFFGYDSDKNQAHFLVTQLMRAVEMRSYLFFILFFLIILLICFSYLPEQSWLRTWLL